VSLRAQGNYDVTKHEKEPTFADFLATLRHRKWLIFSLTVLLAVFLVIVALASDPFYESKGSLQIASQAGGLSAINEYLSMGSGSSLTSEVEIFRSRTVAQKVIDDLGLRVEIRDLTYPNPINKAVMFVLSDRLKRGLRSFRVANVEFPPSSIDKEFYVASTDGNGGFSVTGPSGNLGAGTVNVPFKSDGISFTVTRLVGNTGSKFRVIPRLNHLTLKTFYENLKVAPLGTASRTNLIQVAYKDPEPTLAADVVNAVLAEYDRLDTEWKETQGQAQTKPVEDRLAEISNELTQAEDALVAYSNEHKTVSLPDEARLAITTLSTREGSKADLDIRISVLQDIHRSLSAQLNSDTFSVPPTLIGDFVIQQLATDHARLMVELEDLLLDYTEEHPKVIAQRSAIFSVRQGILGAISSTTQGLIEQRSSLQGMISEIETNLYTMPGVERTLLDLTRKRDVASEVYLVLVKRLNEAQVITSSIAVGNRMVDKAVPPVEPYSPSIKRNGGIGLGSGFILGIIIAFLLEALDPKLRRKDQISHLIGSAPVAFIRRDNVEDLNIAVGALSLAVIKSKSRSLALVSPGVEDLDLRAVIGQLTEKLAQGTNPLFLVDPKPGPDGGSFFGVDPAKGLSDLSRGMAFEFPKAHGNLVTIAPSGSEPSGTEVTSRIVREKITGIRDKSEITLFWVPDLIDNPALLGWFHLTDGAVLVLRIDVDRRKEIQSVIELLESNGVSLMAVLILGN